MLEQFAVGELQGFSAITAGIENSNYIVRSTGGEYVLTLFEHHSADEVREFVRLARHLGQKNLCVPSPVVDEAGEWLHGLKSRPAILCRRFPGAHPEVLTDGHCQAVGEALARFHLASADLENRRCDERGFSWWVNIAPELQHDLNSEDQALLHDEIEWQTRQRGDWQALPHGWIHADLFHDNALFEGDRLTAILDLYNACDGAWLYDLAIVANDWCVDKQGVGLDALKVQALMDGYRSVRNVSDDEWSAWNMVLRGAALRFWLSRLLAERLAQQRGQTLPDYKQPSEYRDRLRWHRNTH